MKGVFRLAIFLAVCAAARGQTAVGIRGTVEWERMRVETSVSLDLAAAGIRLPTGRGAGEALIAGEYLRLMGPVLFSIPVDSSSTLGDLVERGEYSLVEAERLALGAGTVPPALSPDMTRLSGGYSLNLVSLSAALIRHTRPAEVMRTLNPVPAPAYTGIIIIASEELPVHGMKGAALPLPCLFPKIWDSDMNLLYGRNMLDPPLAAERPMVRYASEDHIFRPGPSGLSAEITALVGPRPLRIFARSVFGIRPTDPIIDREDCLLIISSGENRRLLQEGKVVIVLKEEALTTPVAAPPR
ncbi:MAG: polymerase [Treponema sp.]|jgi:hypothetical protein|nr:polymerase [Treponema sp.]